MSDNKIPFDPDKIVIPPLPEPKLDMGCVIPLIGLAILIGVPIIAWWWPLCSKVVEWIHNLIKG